MPPLRVVVCESTTVPIYDKIEVASQVSSLYDIVVQPRVDGFLSTIDYDDGMPVKKGDRLFTIDPVEFSTSLLAAQADLESAKAQELLAHNNYKRAVPLARIKAISQSDLDQYTATYTAARAAVKSAEEACRTAQLNVGYTQILSPIDGLVARSPASEGDYVGPSTHLGTLTTVSFIDSVMVEIPIPISRYLKYVSDYEANSYNNAKLLSNIELTLADSVKYNYGGDYYYTVKDSPNNTSTIVIVVKFPNPNQQLKAGMFARISANIGEEQLAVMVPQGAVSQMQGVNSLWVVGRDSTAKWKQVTLGDTYGDMWAVTSGLNPGEMVLVSGQMKVHNGDKVIPELINSKSKGKRKSALEVAVNS